MWILEPLWYKPLLFYIYGSHRIHYWMITSLSLDHAAMRYFRATCFEKYAVGKDQGGFSCGCGLGFFRVCVFYFVLCVCVLFFFFLSSSLSSLYFKTKVGLVKGENNLSGHILFWQKTFFQRSWNALRGLWGTQMGPLKCQAFVQNYSFPLTDQLRSGFGR